MSEVIRYLAFGYTIYSDIRFEELPINKNQINFPELNILLVDLSCEMKRFIENEEIQFLINEEQVWLFIPNIAVFYIARACTIKVHILDEQRMDVVKMFILGTCIGICLLQNKILPLHGSAIEINGKAYAFIGHSGAGKSTLASAFIQKGYKLISDDVIPVKLDDRNIPVVIPAYPQQKLWKESLDQFGIDSMRLTPLFERETKFAIPAGDHFLNKEVPLGGVFELTKTAENNVIGINSITKLLAFKTLYVHTYRNFLLNDMCLLEWHFKFTANIIERTFVHQIIRPISRFTPNELVNQVLANIPKEEMQVANI
ncbi:aldolase [Bacillus sp. UMB0893]|uniref:aldolase n=1 Tax=Bacillus sp. UMB0893 TaxID=2066053 RepID=UPI000C7584AE|nr:aldolase [Bacillus sp. UMB0893]PLR68725.1 aldolase [Bacillus sp. UMB0893]QNG58491.1 aldolase [Bacillus sp. PAMC26568]